jgi:3-oxoacyl-[acyl-carrier-protein] synthase-1
LREDRVDVAIVGGVDSLVRPEVIERLADEGRLKTEDVPTGVAPAEAAAFVVLEREAPAGVKAYGWLMGSGVAEEPTAGTEDPNEGVGLTKALRAARASAGGGPEHFPRVVCDLNGDRYRAMEWAYAQIRALQDLKQLKPGGPEETDRWHPAEWIGDSGAASGILNVVWALTAMRRGYARIGVSLVWGASEGTLRAAAIVARSEEGE